MSDLILSPEGFGTKIYNRFPPRYREDDVMQHLALKRYLDACGEGGFKYNIEELNGILDFANPDQATADATNSITSKEPFFDHASPRRGRR